jgi:hypothetical protein
MALQSMHPALFIIESYYFPRSPADRLTQIGQYLRLRDKMGQRVIRTDFEIQQKNKTMN